MLISFGDLFFRCFRFLLPMEGGHDTQYQCLIYGNHAPHPVRHVSPRTAKLHSLGIACLIFISCQKAMGDFTMLERSFISSRMCLVMLNFF